ncbi:hypothetical protein [Nonomuraea helvata]|uniref:Uncharacterized protein n=1 Tax=Nonomuraea helvata TaxID=37484 RepID=A0ABV5SI28_9ACTN
MINVDGSYEGPALLAAGDGRLTGAHATIQLAGEEHPLGGVKLVWEATADVEGLVPAGVVLGTAALRVEGSKEDLPVAVDGVAVRRDSLRVSLRGRRHVWTAP